MRHVTFEEMAAHTRQLIQEDRYLSPEELERYQKDQAALEPEAPVFSTPSQVPEQEQESSRSPWRDEYPAVKGNHPNHLILYQVGEFLNCLARMPKPPLCWT